MNTVKTKINKLLEHLEMSGSINSQMLSELLSDYNSKFSKVDSTFNLKLENKLRLNLIDEMILDLKFLSDYLSKNKADEIHTSYLIDVLASLVKLETFQSKLLRKGA